MQALVSDIHGNLEAAEAVLQDLQRIGLKEIICLGDIVGYGPNPGECVDLAGEFAVTLAGNHEEAMQKGPLGFNTLAKESSLWTRKQLRRPFLGFGREKKARWDFLSTLPLRHSLDGNLYVHASPRDPTQEYILRSDTESLFGGVPEKLVDIFRYFEHICFVGHTHYPGIITDEFRFYSVSDFDGCWTLKRGRKLIVNVGSVGQPRDGDNRACYVIHDGDRLYFKRVPYQVEATVEKIKKIVHLNDRNGERLLYGA